MNIRSLFVQMVIFFLSNASTHAGQAETYQSGQSVASSLLGGVTGAAKSTNPHDVPGFQTDKPKEAFLDAGSLGDAALAESRNNEAAQHLHTEAQDRKSFKIDPNTDPLFTEGLQAVADPQKALKTRIMD